MIDQVQGSGITTEQQKKTWLINWYFTYDPMSSIYLATLRNPALVASYQTSPGMLYGANGAVGMETYFIKIKTHFGQSMFDQLVTEFAQQSNLYVDEIKVDEFHMYGSSRLGVYEANRLISKRVARDLNLDNQISTNEYVIETPEEVTYLFSSYHLERGAKRYELANHLGNVLTVISDKKTAICTGNTFNYFAAERISATDYSPFGAPLAGRTWQASEYRFGFNGQEKDDEFKSEGNSITFEFRIHDPRLGKFLSVDPLCNEYPWNSSYAFCENRVIDGIDLEGLEWGGPLFFFARPTPVIRPVVEEFVKPIEVLPKSPEIVPEQFIKPTKNPFSPEQLANLNRGRKIENEQLMKNQLEKNSKPITVETKPGEKTTTIPDSYKNGGKQTVEIKNVKSQSLTRQLRAQKKISNDNGFKPELIINKDANISNPVKTSFEIKYYNIPIAPIDNTTVVPLLISKPNRGNSSSPQTWPQA